MPGDYFKDILRPQLCSLLDAVELNDITITLRFSSLKANSCILSLLSPVLRVIICGNFKESDTKTISLDDVEAARFSKLLHFACGAEGLLADDVEELLELGGLAAFLQMEAVRGQIENMILAELRVENCAEIFLGSKAAGLDGLQKQCYTMLRDEFQGVSQTEGFLKLSEETIGDLLEEDELGADQEEEVFKTLVMWIVSGGEGQRGDGLLRKIRYGVISDEFLAGNMYSALLFGGRVLKELVGEVMARKGQGDAKGVWDGVERVSDKWMVARRMKARILGADVLVDPAYVTIDRQGRLVVSDCELHEVIVFNSYGSVARRFGSEGEAAGQFNSPTGVAVDQQGHILVADRFNHRIQMLNADGSVARIFGSKGTAIGQLDEPQGLTIDNEGHIVVADSGNDRIQVFDVDGSVVRHFGSEGAAVGQLDGPAGVAVDRENRIVVADHGNHRVQVFNGDGSVALCFGSEGEGPGHFKSPLGVAVDREGRFVVADTGNDRVQVFNSDRSLARVVGEAGDGVGGLRCPMGVVVDAAGRIVVAETSMDGSDFNNHRVQIF